jgi:DNA-binding NtrC family response regulator
LIVEDEQTLRDSLQRVFARDGYTVDVTETAEEGLDLARDRFYDAIISDIMLPGMDGIEMLARVREQDPDQTFIVSTAYASLETAVKALRLGAYDYIMKPVIHAEIKQVVRNAIAQKDLRTENRLLRRELEGRYDFTAIIGAETSLAEVVAELEAVSATKASIMLLGETGTGKGLFARVIHHNSDRAQAPFVPINCSAIPENLIESELFGHVKGAFTGATSHKHGLLHEADGGTVFLDEIGDMPLSMQVKLLKALEEGEIRPVGGTRVKQVDLRIVTATNRDLGQLVAKGLFRDDLYYRLNVISLTLPPLRERREDLPDLSTFLLAKYARELGSKPKTVTKEALKLLCAYPWPGNIRELQNVLERAVLIAGDNEIDIPYLPQSLRASPSFTDACLEKRTSLEAYAKRFVLRYQDEHNEAELAEMLGITRKTLWEKRKKWGLKRLSP